jgi:hypothetical protein
MNDKQPEALRLADALSAGTHYKPVLDQASFELRRLHQVEKQRDELLQALTLCRAELVNLTFASDAIIRAREKAASAIAKAEGK